MGALSATGGGWYAVATARTAVDAVATCVGLGAGERGGGVWRMAAPAPYGRLLVTVKEANGTLVKTDTLGKPDPYVRLSFDQHTSVQTGHIQGTAIEGPLSDVNVKWDEGQLELALPRTRTALHVEIVDHDPIPGMEDDDIMAEGYVDLAPLVLAWVQEPEREMESVSEHFRHATNEDAEEGTIVAALTTIDTTQRGTTIDGGDLVSVTMVVKVELPEPALLPPDPPGQRTRRSEDMSVLDFACIAMSTTRSLPSNPDDEDVIHPELDCPNLPKM